MTAQLRQRVWDVFDRAADLPPGERAAFLEEACAGDPGLRAEVESLLAHDAGPPPEADTLVRRPWARPSRRPPLPSRRPGWAVTGSCASWARAAWASSTRPSRTTRAGPSP